MWMSFRETENKIKPNNIPIDSPLFPNLALHGFILKCKESISESKCFGHQWCLQRWKDLLYIINGIRRGGRGGGFLFDGEVGGHWSLIWAEWLVRERENGGWGRLSVGWGRGSGGWRRESGGWVRESGGWGRLSCGWGSERESGAFVTVASTIAASFTVASGTVGRGGWGEWNSGTCGTVLTSTNAASTTAASIALGKSRYAQFRVIPDVFLIYLSVSSVRKKNFLKCLVVVGLYDA